MFEVRINAPAEDDTQQNFICGVIIAIQIKRLRLFRQNQT